MSQDIITQERVIEEVKKAVAETLNSDASKIEADNSLIRDLGAESLDFLDINYRLEQAFGIKIARHFITEHIEDMFGEGAAIDEDGKLTPKALELLKSRFAEHGVELSADMEMDDVPALITIRSMASGIMDILNSLPEKCAKCGAASWKSGDGSHVLCGSCSEPGSFTNGDDLMKDWLKKMQDEKKIF